MSLSEVWIGEEDEEEGKGIWLSWVGGTCRCALWSGSTSGLIAGVGKNTNGHPLTDSYPSVPRSEGQYCKGEVRLLFNRDHVRLCGEVGTPAQYSFL